MNETPSPGSRLSACVITLNEERRLPACLASLSFCDQIVVVDSCSDDRTRETAAAAGALVIENPWPGFGAQRNIAIDHADGEWVLEIDADERVSPRLAEEITRFLADPPADIDFALLPLRDIFLGRELGPSSRYPRYRNRLFRRGAFRHDETRTVHEGAWASGPVVPLEGDLVHLLAGSIGEAVRDTIAYARLESMQRSRPGPAEALKGIVARPAAKLLYRTAIYGGWRDGWQGLVRIGLECGGDSLAAMLRLREGEEGGAAGFGQDPPRLGPVRIVGVALSRPATANLEGWLEQAALAGAEVALVSPFPGVEGGLRRRVTDSGTPSAMIRALDAEEQVRSVDALLLPGRSERALLRIAPASLRGVAPPLSPRQDPAAAVASVTQLSRVGEAG